MVNKFSKYESEYEAKYVKINTSINELIEKAEKPILIKERLISSRHLKQKGFLLVRKLQRGLGLFYFNPITYKQYINRDEFNKVSFVDHNEIYIQLNYLKSLPKHFRTKTSTHITQLFNKIMSNGDTAFIEVDPNNKVKFTEKYLKELFSYNKQSLKYLGIKKIILTYPYDYDTNKWVNINHSVVGRFKEISKCFIIIYTSQLNYNSKEVVAK